MKREQISWWQKLRRRLTTSPLVTAWMGVNSNRDDLYFPAVRQARREGQDVNEAAGQDGPEQDEQEQNDKDEFAIDS